VNPDFRVGRPSSAAIRFAMGPKADLASHATDGPGPAGPQALAHPDVEVGNRSVGFTSAQRFRYHGEAGGPGPGAYSPGLPRASSAHAVPFGKARRESKSNAVDGAPSLTSGTPVMDATAHPDPARSPRGGASVLGTFPRAPRDPRSRTSASPGVGRYSPAFAAVDRRPRSAVLYLGG
jgi:hypothetical protein